MSKAPKVGDKSKAKGDRTARYAAIERSKSGPGSTPAAKQLHRRKRSDGISSRLEHYARIDRGGEA